MKISLVIPTKNEGLTIGDVIKSARSFVDEIIVIDGYSSDNTLDIARSLLGEDNVFLQKTKRGGKGAALRDAIGIVSGDVIVFMDADGSHEAEDIPRLVEPILKDEADMVIASRTKGGSDEAFMTIEGMIRHTGGYIATMIINYRWGASLTEVENGFRAVRTSSIKKLNLVSDDFEIEQEMIIKALKKNMRVTEIGSHEYARKAGESKLPTGKAWRFVWHLIKEMVTD